MEFLGIGYQELLLVMVLLLVVVGPERLPALAYQIGRAVKTMQRYARAVRDEFSDEISYLEEQVSTVKGEINTANESLREQQRELNRDMRAATTTPPELLALPTATETGKNGADTGATKAPIANGAHKATAEELAGANGAKPEEKKTPADPSKPPLVF